MVIPEVPGFAGDIKTEGGLKTIMAAQYRTINRGGHSIYEEIKKAGYEPSVLSAGYLTNVAAYGFCALGLITFASTIFVAMTVLMHPTVRTSPRSIWILSDVVKPSSPKWRRILVSNSRKLK